MKPKIMLDAGHGGKDPGALGPCGEREADVALRVVLTLGSMISRFARPLYTRTTDVFLELGERARLANAAGADYFLSIHCNSGPAGKGDGYEVFTSKGQTASDRLATDLFTAYGEQFPDLRKRMDLSDGDVDKEASFRVLTQTAMPAALFELEFIHTRAGAEFLTSGTNQTLMARALAEGLRRHVGGDPQPSTPPPAAPPAQAPPSVRTVPGYPLMLKMEALSMEMMDILQLLKKGGQE